jgi:hypothetical protein
VNSAVVTRNYYLAVFPHSESRTRAEVAYDCLQQSTCHIPDAHCRIIAPSHYEFPFWAERHGGQVAFVL